MADVEQARERIEEILSQEEYQVYYKDSRNFLEKWWDSVKEWFTNMIADLFGSIAPANGFATGIIILLLIVVVLVIFFAVFLFVRKRMRKGKYAKQAPLYKRHEKDWTYQEHLRQATEFEQTGNLQLATRHLFLALLLHFHEKGLLEAKIWKTNWEYGQEMKRSGVDRAESFLELARIFDEVVYGEQVIDQGSYRAYKETVTYWMSDELRVDMGEG